MSVTTMNVRVTLTDERNTDCFLVVMVPLIVPAVPEIITGPTIVAYEESVHDWLKERFACLLNNHTYIDISIPTPHETPVVEPEPSES